MKRTQLRLRGFRSFGYVATTLTVEPLTFLVGSNGSDKTAVLTALARMFATDSALRQVTRPDLHIPTGSKSAPGQARSLWIEADFAFPEAKAGESKAAVPMFFTHLQMVQAGDIPGMRVR